MYFNGDERKEGERERLIFVIGFSFVKRGERRSIKSMISIQPWLSLFLTFTDS